MMDTEFLDVLSFTIPGIPMSKSNNSIHNTAGIKILSPEYIEYEESIAKIARLSAKNKKFKYKVIANVTVYFKNLRQHVDLNNMPKSICDGIEKSGVISNDIDISSIYFREDFDYDNPRVEVTLYNAMKFKPVYEIVSLNKDEMSSIEEEYTTVQKRKERNLKASEKRKLKKENEVTVEDKFLKAQIKKEKAIKRAEKKLNKKSKEHTCSICNNSFDEKYLNKINGTDTWICRGCILCGYGR